MFEATKRVLAFWLIGLVSAPAQCWMPGSPGAPAPAPSVKIPVFEDLPPAPADSGATFSPDPPAPTTFPPPIFGYPPLEPVDPVRAPAPSVKMPIFEDSPAPADSGATFSPEPIFESLSPAPTTFLPPIFDYPPLEPVDPGTVPISQGPEPEPVFQGPLPQPTDPGESVAPKPASKRKIFDVKHYGAVADGKTENNQKFAAAWKNACASKEDATFLVPKGTYFVSPLVFEGPCHNVNPIEIQIAGTLKAPKNLRAFPKHTWILFKDLDRFILTGTGTGLLDGQGQDSWEHDGCKGKGHCKEYPHTIRFRAVSRGEIREIALLNSKNFHMSFLNASDILVYGVKITAPGDSTNTDGIHVSRSSRINITASKIGVGDDCVSIGPGNTNISISNILCGPGHGISIGSLGKFPDEKDVVVGVTVTNCTLNRTDNGVRIKTWPAGGPGRASNITFEDIKMINVSNPIIIDQQYCPGDKCKSEVSSVNISNISFKNIRGTSQTISAVSLLCSPKAPCKNVVLKDINLTYVQGNTPASAICSNVKGVVFGEQRPMPCFNST